MPTTRLAHTGDAAQLTLLAEQTFRAAFGARNTPENMTMHCAAHYSEALQRGEILDAAIDTVIAEHSGQLVGYTQLHWGPGPVGLSAHLPAEIHRFYVGAEWHGRGVAQRLMATALGLAKARGADRVWLGVWEHNPRAIAFYQKCGFGEAGAHTFMVGTDLQRDIVMARVLLP